MVKEFKTKFSVFYQCGICKLSYENKQWAEKCENWCKKNKGTCNPEFVKHSLKRYGI